MAAAKKRNKKYTPRRGITLPQNVTYWKPVHNAFIREYELPAIAAVSDDVIPDSVRDAIILPYMHALTRFDLGKATFSDYWAIIQTMYFNAHSLHYVLQDERWTFRSEAMDKAWQDKHEQLFHNAETVYTELIYNIGERQKRTGKYGMTGDERKLLTQLQRELNELLDWGTTRMAFNAAVRCVNRLQTVERRVHKRSPDVKITPKVGAA